MSVAGKTGTALLKPAKIRQPTGAVNGCRPDSDPTVTGHRLPGDDGTKEYFSTFVGFFPADNPQVTILVSIDRPDPARTRTTSAARPPAPLFSTLATMAMHELRVSPHRTTTAARAAQDDDRCLACSARWSSRRDLTGSTSSATTRSTSSSGRPRLAARCAPARCSAACGAHDRRTRVRRSGARRRRRRRCSSTTGVDVDRRRSSSSPTPGTAMGLLAASFFGHPSRAADDRRRHRHERQDDDHEPDRLDPRPPMDDRPARSAR